MVHRRLLERVPDTIKQRPLWSVIVPTYNCAHYARETLQSVLIQDPGADKMEIIVVDDASTDGIEDVVSSIGQGRVLFFKQPTNVGHINNFYKGLELSRGELIHILHGDDAVLWGYYREMENLFTSFPDIGAAYCRFHFIDSKSNIYYTGPLELDRPGIFSDFFNKISAACILQTPCISVKRSVYERIGMFDKRLRYTEDWEMWQRIAVYFPVGYSNKVLALYRNNHGANHTLNILKNGESLSDILNACRIIGDNANGRVAGLERQHFDNIFHQFSHHLQYLYKKGDAKTAILYFKRLMRSNLSYYKKYKLLGILGKSFFKSML